MNLAQMPKGNQTRNAACPPRPQMSGMPDTICLSFHCEAIALYQHANHSMHPHHLLYYSGSLFRLKTYIWQRTKAAPQPKSGIATERFAVW